MVLLHAYTKEMIKDQILQLHQDLKINLSTCREIIAKIYNFNSWNEFSYYLNSQKEE